MGKDFNRHKLSNYIKRLEPLAHAYRFLPVGYGQGWRR